MLFWKRQGHVPWRSPCCISFHQGPMGLRWPLPASRLHCVRSSDLWPLCLCLQITSEVHLFSHTKGKSHQQAVRDSSSIQGRELSDEEVVRIKPHPATNKHPLIPSKNSAPLPLLVSCKKKTKRHSGCLLCCGCYCLCFPLYTATALLLALWDYKWALKCTQLGFSASVEGWHHPLVSRLFLSWSAFHGKAAH